MKIPPELALAMLNGSRAVRQFGFVLRQLGPPERPCLNCGKLKRHNNSFCSAECCKQWKEKKK